MTDRETLEGIVNKLYEARAVNDIDSVMSHTGPGFSFCILGSGKLSPMAQRVSEPAAVDAAVRGLVADWDMSKIETTRIYVDGDTVFAHRAGPIRYKGGKEIQTEYLDRFTFKDGKIIDLTEFVDTLMVAETVGLLDA
jgi:ketosteroid isomerase-like protein